MNLITEFGKERFELPGYWELYEDQRKNSALATEYSSNEISSEATFYAFAKDVFEFSLMMDFVRENRFELNWNNTLDIGGMEGTVSRLMKINRFSKFPDCVDIHDYSVQLSDALFAKHMRKYNLLTKVLPRRTYFNFQSHFDYKIKGDSTLKNLSSTGDASINHYYTEGFFNFNPSHRYDFISAFLCMPYFELESFFTRLSDLMDKGGVFYFLSDYWWGQCNSTGLVGGIPWGIQRFTKDDLAAYFAARGSEISEQIIQKKLSYYHQGVQRPTLSDYVQIAAQHGFSLVASRRHFGDAIDGERIFLTPDVIDSQHPLDIVLEDIADIRPGVSRVDLLTSFLSCIFVKN